MAKIKAFFVMIWNWIKGIFGGKKGGDVNVNVNVTIPQPPAQQETTPGVSITPDMFTQCVNKVFKSKGEIEGLPTVTLWVKIFENGISYQQTMEGMDAPTWDGLSILDIKEKDTHNIRFKGMDPATQQIEQSGKIFINENCTLDLQFESGVGEAYLKQKVILEPLN